MEKYEFYSLKDLLEDFYISELSSTLEVEKKDINYYTNNDIIIDGKNVETLLSAKGTSKKKVFKKAESRVLEFLRKFKCIKNSGVENFLHDSEQAIRFQKESLARTYLLIEPNSFDIVAYFSLAIKPILIKENYKISNGKRKKLNSKIMDENIEICSTFLIGQIGRHDNYSSNDINLGDILNYIFGVINKVRELIGGRIVLIEVDKEPKLIKRYEEFNFENIESDSEFTQLMQWINSY